MESLRELYRIGYGPSSSHTMGPRSACEMFISSHPEAKTVKAELYGSLAATGKGHLTDHAIREVFSAHGINAEIKWFPDEFKTFHPNALTLIETEPETAEETYYSVGGGKVIKEGDAEEKTAEPYDNEKLGSMSRLLKYSDSNGYQFWEVAIEAEGNDILDYMREVWTVMKDAIRNGLEAEGVLPGGLHLQRKACQSYAKAKDFSGPLGSTALAFSYALAVSEENAGGGKIVTAPTCGSCGVLPGVLYHMMQEYQIPEIRILRALLTAGMVGNIVKENGSISGAEVGCQGEV
ncbi:MAG: L-serine ammonia-lyase, iron-sulfur-dependent, subunit alpha, partial [Spirochaetes bacterium]|nr:L-serine ammonia-lyase, iron-sulfur-dependent, subunit alpha [Candidatus Ornithospirochaeta stercoravium]